MKLSQVQEILETEVLCGNDLLRRDVCSSFACGLISEMLLYVTPDTIDTTSLTKIHVIHSDQVIDAAGVVLECCDRLFLNNFKDNTKPMDTTYVG